MTPDRRAGRSSAVTDDLIVELLGRGDFRALDALAHRYGGRLRSYLARLVGEASADDLTHDVLVRAFERHDGRRAARSFPAWLFRVARTAALDELRARSRRGRILRRLHARGRAPGTETASASPARSALRRETGERLERALRQLPEDQRSVFLLREVEGLSYEELSEVMGVNTKTISTRLHRARSRLRELLRDLLDGETAS